MKNVLLVLLVLACMTLGGLYGNARKALQSPAVPVAVHDALKARVAALETVLDERQQENLQLRDQLAIARAAHTVQERKPAAAPLPLALTTSMAPRLLLNSNVLQRAPASVTNVVFTNAAAGRLPRQNIGAWSRMREYLYDDLLARADLSDTQKMDFRRLMRMRRSAEFASSWLSDAETSQLVLESETGLKKLLGERYGELELYERQLPVRMFTERFDLFLAAGKGRLAPDKKNELIIALIQVPGMTTDLAPPAAPETPGNRRDVSTIIERQLEQVVRQRDQIAAAARPVLTAEENKALAEFLAELTREPVEVVPPKPRPTSGPEKDSAAPPAAARKDAAPPAVPGP